MKHCNTKKYRWSGMALFVLLLGSLLLLPSCEKEEVNNDPLLFSFGPSPLYVVVNSVLLVRTWDR